jgi:DNA-binding beta-propeller fold protein YncE
MSARYLLLGLLAAAPMAAQAPSIPGTLIITNKTPATATIIDAGSGRILATLPTGEGPHEVVAAKNGSVAVVTDYGSQTGGSTLTVIDLGSRTVARTISLGEYKRPHGIVFLPGDSIVAVTLQYSWARNSSISRSRSTMSLSATDWTRPADLAPGSLRQSTGERVNPTR